MSGDARPAPANDADTWFDDGDAARPAKDISLGPQQRHHNSMQSRVLAGIGGIFVVTLLAVVLGPGLNAISEDLALTLAQTILPATLAAGGTVVGTLFNETAAGPPCRK